MTRRLRLAPALALLALAALPPAGALAVDVPTLTVPAASPSYTNQAPTLGWADVSNEDSYEVLKDAAPCVLSSAVPVAFLLQNATGWTDPASLAPGTTYCYWVRAVDLTGPDAESNQKVIVYDTTSPTGTVTAPAGAAVVGGANVTVSSDALDDLAGVSTVTFQKSPAGASTWTLIGLDSVAGSWSVAWDTTSLADGAYDVRAVIADAAGNTFNTAAVANVRVDNTAPAVTQISPTAGTQITGTTQLAATASDDAAGVATVQFERSPAGEATWTTIGAESSALDGWTFSFDSTAVADGLYDLRALAVDTLGNGAASASVTSVRIDNTPPEAPKAPTAIATATNGSVTLVWPVSPTDDVVGYHVYRDGATMPLNGSLLMGSTYVDDSLALDGSADGAHTYLLRAADPTQLSAASSAVSVTLDTVTPAPASVTATPQTSGAISLSWPPAADRAASSGATGTIADVVVRRSAAGGSAPASATDGISVCTPGSAHSCTDSGTVRGATYAYSVFVRDTAGNASRGSASAKASDSVKTPTPTPTKPAPPGNVRTKVDHLGRTMLLWQLPADRNLARVVVVRGTAKHKPRSPGDGKRLYSGMGTRVALKLAPGTSTWISVFAVGRAGSVSPAIAKRIAIGAISPGEGAELDGPVKLDWVQIPKADYYNVQLFRNGKRVLIDWPRASKLGLAKGKLVSGDYTAYVWPGYGELSQARFGKLIGSASFSYRR